MYFFFFIIIDSNIYITFTIHTNNILEQQKKERKNSHIYISYPTKYDEK